MLNQPNDKTNEYEKNNSQSGRSLHYKSFLVRLWRDQEAAPWRASVTHIPTQETRTFSNIQALLIYLHNQTTAVNDDQKWH